MSREDDLEDFIVDDGTTYNGYPESQSDTESDDSMDDGDNCTYYADATATERARERARHGYTGRDIISSVMSSQALGRWFARRPFPPRDLETNPNADEAETPTSPSYSEPELTTDED